MKLELDSEMTSIVMVALYLTTFLVRTMIAMIILKIKCVLPSKRVGIVNVLKLMLT